jgi:hypothetical protein
VSKFVQWFRPLSWAKRTPAHKSRRRERGRLAVEVLEQRQLLSTTQSLVAPQALLSPATAPLSQQAPALSVAGLGGVQLSGGVTPQKGPSTPTLPQPGQDGYYQNFPQGIEVGLSKWIWNLSDNSKSHWQETFLAGQDLGKYLDPTRTDFFLDYDSDHYLKDKLDDGWAQNEDSLKQDILSQTYQSIVDQTKSLPGGPTYAYNNDPVGRVVSLAASGAYSAKINPDSSLQLKYVLTGNSVRFAVSIPTAYRNLAAIAAVAANEGLLGPLNPVAVAAGLAVWAAPDPTFTATFDVEVDVNLKIPSTLDAQKNNLQVSVQTSVHNAHIDTTNWSSTLIGYMGDLIGDVKALVYHDQNENAIFAPAERAMEKTDPNQATKLQNKIQGKLGAIQGALTAAAQQGYIGFQTWIVPFTDSNGQNVGRVHFELTQIPLETFNVQINQVTEQFNTHDPRYVGTVPSYWIGQNLPSVVTGDPTVDRETGNGVTLTQVRTVPVNIVLTRQFLPGTGITHFVGGTGPGKTVDGSGQLFNGEIQRPAPGQTPLPANPGVCLIVKLLCDYATGSISGGTYDSSNHYLGSVSGTRGTQIVTSPNADFGAPGLAFTIQTSGPLNTEGTAPPPMKFGQGLQVTQQIQGIGLASRQTGQSAGQASLASSAVAAVLPTIAAPLTDVTAQLAISLGSLTLDPTTKHYKQTVTLKNTSGKAIVGPLSLVLDNLSANVKLVNKTGVTVQRAPAGSPYVDVSLFNNVLTANQSVTVVLEFDSPTAAISYKARVLSGTGPR